MSLITDGIVDSASTAISISVGETVFVPLTASEAASDSVSDIDDAKLNLDASSSYTLLLTPQTAPILHGNAAVGP